MEVQRGASEHDTASPPDASTTQPRAVAMSITSPISGPGRSFRSTQGLDPNAPSFEFTAGSPARDDSDSGSDEPVSPEPQLAVQLPPSAFSQFVHALELQAERGLLPMPTAASVGLPLHAFPGLHLPPSLPPQYTPSPPGTNTIIPAMPVPVRGANIASRLSRLSLGQSDAKAQAQTSGQADPEHRTQATDTKTAAPAPFMHFATSGFSQPRPGATSGSAAAPGSGSGSGSSSASVPMSVQMQQQLEQQLMAQQLMQWQLQQAAMLHVTQAAQQAAAHAAQLRAMQSQSQSPSRRQLQAQAHAYGQQAAGQGHGQARRRPAHVARRKLTVPAPASGSGSGYSSGSESAGVGQSDRYERTERAERAPGAGAGGQRRKRRSPSEDPNHAAVVTAAAEPSDAEITQAQLNAMAAAMVRAAKQATAGASGGAVGAATATPRKHYSKKTAAAIAAAAAASGTTNGSGSGSGSSSGQEVDGDSALSAAAAVKAEKPAATGGEPGPGADSAGALTLTVPASPSPGPAPMSMSPPTTLSKSAALLASIATSGSGSDSVAASGRAPSVPDELRLRENGDGSPLPGKRGLEQARGQPTWAEKLRGTPAAPPLGEGTGLVYDARCLLHDGGVHAWETPERVEQLYQRLQDESVLQKCTIFGAREATVEELTTTHSQAHVDMILKTAELPFSAAAPFAYLDEFRDTFVGRDSALAARLCVGGLIDLAVKVCAGELRNGMAALRPPGHHADCASAEGFCLFNGIATAARVIQSHPQCQHIRKILIVDWDVHHGNGTQNVFYEERDVLYFSLHRFEDKFYPGTGSMEEVGGATNPEAIGRTVNMPLPAAMADAEYLEVFKRLLLPIAKDFRPDLILVSAGFDAAAKDPLGGMGVTPACFSRMTSLLMDICSRVVLLLEGGYAPPIVAECGTACVRTLTGERPLDLADMLSSTAAGAAAATASAVQAHMKNDPNINDPAYSPKFQRSYRERDRDRDTDRDTDRDRETGDDRPRLRDKHMDSDPDRDKEREPRRRDADGDSHRVQHAAHRGPAADKRFAFEHATNAATFAIPATVLQRTEPVEAISLIESSGSGSGSFARASVYAHGPSHAHAVPAIAVAVAVPATVVRATVLASTVAVAEAAPVAVAYAHSAHDTQSAHSAQHPHNAQSVSVDPAWAHLSTRERRAREREERLRSKQLRQELAEQRAEEERLIAFERDHEKNLPAFRSNLEAVLEIQKQYWPGLRDRNERKLSVIVSPRMSPRMSPKSSGLSISRSPVVSLKRSVSDNARTGADFVLQPFRTSSGSGSGSGSWGTPRASSGSLSAISPLGGLGSGLGPGFGSGSQVAVSPGPNLSRRLDMNSIGMQMDLLQSATMPLPHPLPLPPPLHTSHASHPHSQAARQEAQTQAQAQARQETSESGPVPMSIGSPAGPHRTFTQQTQQTQSEMPDSQAQAQAHGRRADFGALSAFSSHPPAARPPSNHQNRNQQMILQGQWQ